MSIFLIVHMLFFMGVSACKFICVLYSDFFNFEALGRWFVLNLRKFIGIIPLLKRKEVLLMCFFSFGEVCVFQHIWLTEIVGFLLRYDCLYRILYILTGHGHFGDEMDILGMRIFSTDYTVHPQNNLGMTYFLFTNIPINLVSRLWETHPYIFEYCLFFSLPSKY